MDRSGWRANFIPRVISDFGAFIFLSAMIPAVYIFEIGIVVPKYFEHSPTWLQYFHTILGTFALINIIGNFVGTVMVDTSIKNVFLPSEIPENSDGWHFCASCESVVPPRTWHCYVCNICILKREHHCIFTGYCIGHKNHRYFMLFVIYMWISTAYASIFNHYFIWNLIGEVTWRHIFRMVMPAAVFVLGLDTSITQVYIFFYSVVIVGNLFISVLLYQQGKLLLSGITTNEKNHHVTKYNFGMVQNFKEVFGERWYLAMFVPFIESALPHDGVNWDVLAKARSGFKSS